MNCFGETIRPLIISICLSLPICRHIMRPQGTNFYLHTLPGKNEIAANQFCPIRVCQRAESRYGQPRLMTKPWNDWNQFARTNPSANVTESKRGEKMKKFVR